MRQGVSLETFPKINNSNINKLHASDRSAHDWYRFVLSYPPHLVTYYLQKFEIGKDQWVLDPFCGTGTTLVECKKNEIPSIGIESIPMTSFASKVKVDWSLNPAKLIEHARSIAEVTIKKLDDFGIEDDPLSNSDITNISLKKLPEEAETLILKDSISPRPLHKVLVLLESIEKLRNDKFHDHERLALAKAVVTSISNLHFGPEVGINKIKIDSPVVSVWMREIFQIAQDISELSKYKSIPAIVYQADSRDILKVLPPNSIDAVITSPPYPNEKDYTRIIRLESVLLGFMKNKNDLRNIKKSLLRSNTRNVYKDDDDDHWVEQFAEIQDIATQIENRRIELGKTSGFERLYPRVTKLYFGGMYKHLSDLRPILKPGSYLAYVVGDQASYLKVLIRTGKILGDIGKSLGYELTDIDLFRTRRATATKAELREEVVILRWLG